ncbi:MAG: class II fructose-bisphosphate aldolase [Clostridiales Family XIII bacterium]|jgi:fructose/tagatose bisphosphate aldolase|nr:class II fructose-bisphosphate aldolase [Clostridiales Family XIII bacterium]
MSFITDKEEAKGIFSLAAGKNVSIALFCTGSFWNTEAILLAASRFAEKRGIKDIPVVVAMTSLYAHMQQARRITYSKDPKIGLRTTFEYCRSLCEGPYAPYPNVAVMTHLDHADPKVDQWALTENTDLLTSVMFDAQVYPYEENLAMAKDYVQAYGDKVLVEGIIEGLAVGDGTASRQSDDYVEKAVRFVKETGVDFLVADLGTEQQSSGTDAHYLKDRAQTLTRELGRPMLVLHGVSSMKNEDIHGLAEDGVIRVNMWTRIVRESGQYAAKRLAGRLDRIEAGDFEATEATAYINDNIEESARVMEHIMDGLGYGNLA